LVVDGIALRRAKTGQTRGMGSAIERSNERARMAVELAGGRLAQLSVDGLELLVAPTERPTRWGSFPMIPWCGRLPNGRLEFGGATHEFPITSPPHANHGRAHLQDWTEREDHTGSEAAFTIATELADPWPLGGTVSQRFELTDTSLTVTATVTATDQAMPAMIGWHPWFNRQLHRGEPAELRVAGGSVYATDPNDIPTGELVAVPPRPWNACFVGLETDPVIEWAGALSLTVSSTFDHWVLFTEPDHALCVEPQSGPPNQVHLAPVVVEPGECLSGSMTLSWA
jgi:aldose 1-epimerase